MPQNKIVGTKYNRLTIIEDLGVEISGRYVKTQCECGKITTPQFSQLVSGEVKSCGCYSREIAAKRLTTHGMSGTRLYNIWKDMRRRCNNPNRKNYKHYGERGISVCDEWEDYKNFYDWAMSNGYDDSLSIDRIDTNKNYEPSNCRWATSSMQNSNTNKNKPFKAISPNKDIFIHESQAEFAREHGLNRKYINSCLIGKQNTYQGWKFEYMQ